MLPRTPIFLAVAVCLLANSACTKSAHRRAKAGAKNPVVHRWESSIRRTVRTTAYCHLENEPGAVGKKTALGTTLRYGRIRSAAADWSRYPVGTQFRIMGERHLYEIDDYGSALVGTGTIDLYKPTLRSMKEWGVRNVNIQIVKWGSFDRSAAILSKRTQYPHCKEMLRCIQSY